MRHVREKLGLQPARLFQLAVLLLKPLLEQLQLGDVARRGEYPLQDSVAVMEGCRVVRHDSQSSVSCAGRELVVGDFAFVQHLVDCRLGPARVGEVVLEGGADQLIARASCQPFHLLVDVGDDAAGIRGHQRVDIRF